MNGWGSGDCGGGADHIKVDGLVCCGGRGIVNSTSPTALETDTPILNKMQRMAISELGDCTEGRLVKQMRLVDDIFVELLACLDDSVEVHPWTDHRDWFGEEEEVLFSTWLLDRRGAGIA